MAREKSKYFGRDQHQNPVIVCSRKNIIGQEKSVLIKKFSQHTIYGELIDTDNFPRSLNMSKIEKSRSELQFKKIDKETINIKVHNNDVLVSVVGEFNSNLNELEKLTKTQIFLGETQLR